MIVCMKCGQQADQDETFCRRCGSFLEWAGAPAAPPESPPPVTPGPPPSRPDRSEPEPAGSPLLVVLSATGLRVEPGGQASLTVEVRNRGRTVDQLVLEVRGPAATWAAFEPARLNLMPDTSAVAVVTFRPARAPIVRAGTYPTEVVVSSSEHPDAAVRNEVAVEVLPFAALELSLAPSVLRGSVATPTRLRVTNGGNTAIALAIGGDDPEMAFDFRHNPPRLGVEPGATAEAIVVVVPRQPIRSGPERPRPFRVLVAGSDGSRRALDGTFIQIAVSPPPEPEIVGPPLVALLGASTVRVEAGGQAAVTVEVTNRDRVADRVSLEVRGPVAAWASVEPARLSIEPGTKAVATVAFRPPRSPDVATGRYQADVAVISKEHPAASVVERVAVELLPFVTVEAILSPSVLRGRREATSKLTVANRGNVPLELSLSGDDPEAALQFRVSPSTLRLKPGAAGYATVGLKARVENRSRTELARPFRAVVATAEGSRQAVDGTFIQPAARGRRRWPCLVVLLGLLGLAALVGLSLGPGGLPGGWLSPTPDTPHAPPIENTTGQPIYDERVMVINLDPGARHELKVMDLWSAPVGLEPSCAGGFFLLTWQVRQPYPEGGQDLLIETVVPMSDGRLVPRGTGASGSATLGWCDEGFVVNNGTAPYTVELRHASGVYAP